MEKEIWKDVVGYEGLYQISNCGKIRTVSRYVHIKHRGFEGFRLVKQKEMKPYIYNRYIGVSLTKDGKSSQKLIHRLVAEAFIPNPDNLPFINHKDENPSNNNVNNLEWCMPNYNCNYGNRNSKISNSRKGMKFSEEHIKNMRIAGKKRVTPEFREKMRNVHLGTKLSEEHKKKISVGVRKAKKKSQ